MDYRVQPLSEKMAMVKYLLGACAVAVLTGCGSNAPSEQTDATAAQRPARTQQLPAQLSDRKAKLKVLWKQGAAAKQRGDYKGARRAWQAALNLAPGHPGFQEAIDKLPKTKKRGKMVGMTFDTPPELQVGDEVETTTAIRRYDIVCWERVGEHKLIMRTLSPQEAATYKGRKFQIDKGDKPGQLKYIEVK